MQAIIRFSVDGETNSALRNKLAGALEGAGFARSGNTATYRHDHIETAEIAEYLRSFWDSASAHKGPGRVDHFWMYTDRGVLDDILPEAVAAPVL